MLKLLLGHWQAHREPLPFVLTDDPLYCSHLTKSPFPEVYSVNRINPIFEDDENEPKSESSSIHLKRSLSEESRENETRASDDTGYSSSGHLRSVTTADSLTDDVGSLEARHMSSDSDEYSQPEAVVVSVDVHRVSYPDDVIVLSSNSSVCSHTFSANSYSSHYAGSGDSSPEPFDSLTMSTITDSTTAREGKQKSTDTTEVKRSNLVVREKLQKLLEKGNDRSTDSILDSLDPKPSTEREIEKTRIDLMKSLTRAINNKVPNKEDMSPVDTETVTRIDSAVDDKKPQPKSLDRKSISSSTSPKSLYFAQSSNQKESNGVTRQDESSASSSVSYTKPRKHQNRNGKKHSEKESKRSSMESTRESLDSQKSQVSHKCKLCENAHRPLAFHQLLPGHWSYDNVYLPQIPNMYCSCMYHHHHSKTSSSDDDVFYPMYYSHDMARARHSWAPITNSQVFSENIPKSKRSSEGKSVSTSHKENGKESSSARYSPDGSSRETDTSQTDSNGLKHSLSERRSLREPKKCKCEHCLGSVLDKDGVHNSHFGSHTCPCHCLPHRRVKFASDTDVSQHRHMHTVPVRVGKDGKFANGEPINAAFVMNLPHLNGHALTKNNGMKENGIKSKKAPTLVPRGLKEPIKMDELYHTYPINFRDWEAHYRRNYLQKRRKRAINMVGMAIGIILVVGIAVAMTFVFLRIRRPV